MDKILCPHCKEPLVVRCYYERYIDLEPVIQDGLLEVNEHDCEMVNFSDDASDEFTDYECASCKEDVSDLIGNPAKGGENNE